MSINLEACANGGPKLSAGDLLGHVTATLTRADTEVRAGQTAVFDVAVTPTNGTPLAPIVSARLAAGDEVYASIDPSRGTVTANVVQSAAMRPSR